MKFLGHWRIFFFRVAKTEKKCPEEHIKESPFSKGKNLLNFRDSERNIHFNLAENFVRVVKTVTYVALEDFEEKNMFETLHFVSNFLWILDKNIRALFRKFFQSCHKCHPRVHRKVLRKTNSFTRETLFFVRTLDLQQFFFVPWQISYLGEPKQQFMCLEETFVGTLLWKTVFFNCWDFEQRNLDFLWKNNGTFVETVA